MSIILSAVVFSTITLSMTIAPPRSTILALSISDNVILAIITAVLGVIFGAAGSYVASHFKVKELHRSFDLKVQELQTQMNLQQSLERKNQEINLRLRYINPLRFATNQLCGRLSQIQEKMSSEFELGQMKGWFHHIKQFCEEGANRDARGFNVWCHYEGIFAMTTLHYTSIQFAHTIAIFKADPFREIDPEYSVELADHLNQVRVAFAQDAANGIWRESQDNAGLSISKVDMIMNYDEFCKHLVDTSSGPNYGPFLRLIDFYREFIYARAITVSEIMSALVSLREFLNATPSLGGSSATNA